MGTRGVFIRKPSKSLEKGVKEISNIKLLKSLAVCGVDWAFSTEIA
jgi:hypothetical protein